MIRSKLLAATFLAAIVAASSSGALFRRGEPLVQRTDRTSVRVVYFGNSGVSSEYTFNYASPAWSADYASGFDSLTLGKRVRLGKDYWSSLDNFGDLEIGGKKVKAGYWFLALERSKKGAWSLVLLDDDDVRGRIQDAFASANTTGGLVIPVEHQDLQEPADRLHFEITPVAGKQLEQTLSIRFGPHELKVGIKARG